MHKDAISPQAVNDLIRSRRAIYPEMYTDEPIERSIIEQLLENANWAPTHRLTEPWRFHVFRGEARQRLADYLADYYQNHTPVEFFSEVKLKKTREKPLLSDTVIAIILYRDPKESLPEWEELAAVACAVQNMWLSCTAYGLGCYWSTPQSMLDAGDWLGLAPNERCLGLFYIGRHRAPELPGRRASVGEKVVWK